LKLGAVPKNPEGHFQFFMPGLDPGMTIEKVLPVNRQQMADDDPAKQPWIMYISGCLPLIRLHPRHMPGSLARSRQNRGDFRRAGCGTGFAGPRDASGSDRA
jgi:hypothetical protein